MVVMKKFKKIWLVAVVLWFIVVTFVDYFFGHSIRANSWFVLVFSIVKTTIILIFLYKLVSDRPK